MPTASDRVLYKDTAAIGVGLSLLYLSFHSTLYNFDGVACAIAVELGNLKLLVHGNHMAYGAAGWLFFSAWKLAGYHGPALLALQVLNSLFGAATAAVFFTALARAGARRSVAAAAALGLALSQGYWLWSLEAQVYPLGLFWMAWALREALSSQPRAARLGLFQGLAMLGHVSHAMFAPAALYLMHQRFGAGWRRAWGRWMIALAATLLAAYSWAAIFCVKPSSLEDLRVWLLGSAALKLDKSFAWHGTYSWRGTLDWAQMTVRIFCDYSPFTGAARATALLLGLLCLALSAFGGWTSLRTRCRPQAVACALWLVSYAALFLSWEPYTMVYRLGDLLPLWLLIALALQTLSTSWYAAALAAMLGAFNGAWGIAPHTHAANNRAYLEATQAGLDLPADSWIVASGMGQVYYPYFGHLKPLNMRYWDWRLLELAAELDALAGRGQRLFVTESTLAAGGWKGWFESYGLRLFARSENGTFYEIRRKENPAAARKKG